VRWKVSAQGLTLTAARAARLRLRDLGYGGPERILSLRPGETRRVTLDLAGAHHWYDVELVGEDWRVRLAGHWETGRPSFSDPAAHGPARLAV
jgi:phospholipase C